MIKAFLVKNCLIKLNPVDAKIVIIENVSTNSNSFNLCMRILNREYLQHIGTLYIHIDEKPMKLLGEKASRFDNVIIAGKKEILEAIEAMAGQKYKPLS
ncbi:MAG: hypothetical protein JXA77_16460 [Bacteroidales bacterium]|nr:hypothetical protein [Bacteroidales bacterium]MBN2818896.1 hypothetical protein [Bacteroidales bacterium]